MNEQARISLLLAGPGVIATLAFAPLALWLLYSPGFVAATEVLRWICLGIALRVVTWPIGYIIVARNARALFIATELFWAILNVGLTLVLVRSLGLEGAGVAFFLSYVAHGIVVYAIVRRLTGFRWSAPNLATGGVYLGSIAVAAVSFLLLPPAAATALAVLLVVIITVYAVYVLTTLVAADDLPGPLLRLLQRARLSRSARAQFPARARPFRAMPSSVRDRVPTQRPNEGGIEASSSQSPAGPTARSRPTMKILVYAHRLEVGGTQVNAIELAAALRDAHGFDVVLFAQAGPMVSLVQEKRLRYVPAPDARFHPSFARMHALRDLVRREQPDLLHVWDWWQCLDAFYSVHLPYRLPMVVTDMMMEFTRVLPRYVPITFGVPALADMALQRGYRRAVPLVPPVDIVTNASWLRRSRKSRQLPRHAACAAKSRRARGRRW